MIPPRLPRPLPTGLAAVATLVLFLALALPAGAAQAASSRFWGYYQLSGTTWQFATTGPDQVVPADGSVEGWRYAVAAMDAPRFPRVVPTFEQLCGSTPTPADGSKRVGVVVDYGRVADTADGSTPPEPRGACAVVPTNASGTDVLTSVAQVRLDKGLVCGLDGQPAKGCFEEVASPAPPAAAPDRSVTLPPAAAPTPAATAPAAEERTGFGMSMTIGAALVTLLAVVAAIWMTMRRRSRTPRD